MDWTALLTSCCNWPSHRVTGSVSHGIWKINLNESIAGDYDDPVTQLRRLSVSLMPVAEWSPKAPTVSSQQSRGDIPLKGHSPLPLHYSTSTRNHIKIFLIMAKTLFLFSKPYMVQNPMYIDKTLKLCSDCILLQKKYTTLSHIRSSVMTVMLTACGVFIQG